MDQIVQVVGAVLILAAFAGAQFGVLSTRSYRYLVLNLCGSAVLAVVAFNDQQWGFFLLEAVWAAVSLWSLVARLAGMRVVDAG